MTERHLHPAHQETDNDSDDPKRPPRHDSVHHNTLPAYASRPEKYGPRQDTDDSEETSLNLVHIAHGCRAEEHQKQTGGVHHEGWIRQGSC